MSLHNWKSDSVGHSVGHHMQDLVLFNDWCNRTSCSILFPKAIRMSERNRICRKMRTRLSLCRLSQVYPLSSSNCIMNRPPSRGYFMASFATTIFTPNIEIFSHSIFIQKCVERNPYLLYDSCRGWNEIPSSTRNRE
jgi:hypothetical protein